MEVSQLRGRTWYSCVYNIQRLITVLYGKSDLSTGLFLLWQLGQLSSS